MDSFSTIVDTLGSALDGAVARCIDGNDRLALLFSGGLDSSLLAKVCEDNDVEVKLFSSAMDGSFDYRHLGESANLFKYDFELITIRNQELLGYANMVVAATNSRLPLDVSIGIPLFACCESAKKGGFNAVMVGQGADELFAGYHRYLAVDRDDLEKELSKDLRKLLASGMRRDTAIARANALELRAPYLDEDFVKLAKMLPLEMKIRRGVRKYVLRELARKRGLQPQLYEREKKAIQYSTGADKGLRRIARRDKIKSGEFLKIL